MELEKLYYLIIKDMQDNFVMDSLMDKVYTMINTVKSRDKVNGKEVNLLHDQT